MLRLEVDPVERDGSTGLYSADDVARVESFITGLSAKRELAKLDAERLAGGFEEDYWTDTLALRTGIAEEDIVAAAARCGVTLDETTATGTFVADYQATKKIMAELGKPMELLR